MCESVQNSPGSRAMEVMTSIHKDLIFKIPKGLPKRKRKMVLDEETYVEVKYSLYLNAYFRNE